LLHLGLYQTWLRMIIMIERQAPLLKIQRVPLCTAKQIERSDNLFALN